MKKLFTTLFLIPLATSLYAQTPCDDLKSENAQLKKDVVYLKETMQLLNSKVTSTIENIEFSINEVIGNKETNEVEIIGIYKNLGAMKTFQARDAKLIDPQGNQYQSYAINLTEKRARVENVRTDIPMKFSILFKGIDSKTPQIRLLSLRLYSQQTKNAEGTFENIDINWK